MKWPSYSPPSELCEPIYWLVQPSRLIMSFNFHRYLINKIWKRSLKRKRKNVGGKKRRQKKENEFKYDLFSLFFFSMRFWNAILADDLRLLFSHIDEIKKNPPTDYAVTKGIINCEFGKTFTLPSTCREVLSNGIKAETISVPSVAPAYKRMIVRRNFDLLLKVS